MKLLVSVALFAYAAALSAQDVANSALRGEIDAFNQSLVAAFQKSPASVAAFYTDDAAIIGAGQRHQGRDAVNAYWAGGAMFTKWSLETLEVGGPTDAPWQYGRSVAVGQSGRSMETYFVGLLRRQGAALRFRADVFARATGTTGADAATRVTNAWLAATERGDAKALQGVFDDQYVILSTSGARNKAQEIAELVPTPGVALPYFRSEETQTRGFGTLAVTTGILRWEYNGRKAERNYASVAADRGNGWKIVAQQVTPRS